MGETPRLAARGPRVDPRPALDARPSAVPRQGHVVLAAAARRGPVQARDAGVEESPSEKGDLPPVGLEARVGAHASVEGVADVPLGPPPLGPVPLPVGVGTTASPASAPPQTTPGPLPVVVAAARDPAERRDTRRVDAVLAVTIRAPGA